MKREAYSTGVPMEDPEIMDELCALESKHAAIDRRIAEAKAASATAKAESEEVTTRARFLVKARGDGKPVYRLLDGTYTFDAPQMGLFVGQDVAGAPPAAAGSTDRPLELFPDVRRYTATRPAHDATDVAAASPEEEAEVRREADGKWWGRCGGRPYAMGLPSRSEAVEEVEKGIGEKLAWTPDRASAEAPPEVPSCYRATYKGRRLSVTRETVRIEGVDVERWIPTCATGEDVEARSAESFEGSEEGRGAAMEKALGMAGFDSADARPEWTPDPIAEPAAPVQDDGAIYEATLEDGGTPPITASVGQAEAGKPWCAFVGAGAVGAPEGYATSGEARSAVEESLRTSGKLAAGASLAWGLTVPATPAPVADSPAAAEKAPEPAPVS